MREEKLEERERVREVRRERERESSKYQTVYAMQCRFGMKE